MDIIKIALVILVSLITISCLPVFDKSISAVIGIATAVIVLWFVISTITPLVQNIKSFFDSQSGLDLGVIYKSMGISLLTQFVADMAVDTGNNALANQMIFTGKLAIIMLAMPIYIQILEILGQILK